MVSVDVKHHVYFTKCRTWRWVTQQGHTHWDHEVHARLPTNANQTESGAGQGIPQCCRNSHSPLREAVKDTKGCRLGKVKFWTGHEDVSVQVYQPTQFKQTKESKRYPNRFRHLYETLLPENLGRHCREWPASKTDSQGQSFSFRKTANCKFS